MSEFKLRSEAAIRRSYLEQGQHCQARRWLAACLGGVNASGLRGLFAAEFKVRVDGRESSSSTGIFSLAGLRVSSIESGVVSEGKPLRLQLLGVRFNDSAEKAVGAYAEIFFSLGGAATELLLPEIQKIDIKTTAAAEDTSSTDDSTDDRDSAMPHRLLALKHRWHAMVESPRKYAEIALEIITEDFAMDWGAGSVNSYAEFERWLTGSASSVGAARHDIAGFNWSRLHEDVLEARFEFDWSGLSLKEEPMQARSNHTWRIHDNPAERFPRIRQMRVELLVPFHVVRT